MWRCGRDARVFDSNLLILPAQYEKITVALLGPNDLGKEAICKSLKQALVTGEAVRRFAQQVTEERASFAQMDTSVCEETLKLTCSLFPK
jgi:hypothetical protein